MLHQAQWGEERAVLADEGSSQRRVRVDGRQRLGQYATPPALVAQMLEWVGYQPEADLEGVTLLDPSCGSGNFLVAAAQRLLARGRGQGWSQERLLAALRANLCGIEADPTICAIAEQRLLAFAAEAQSSSPAAEHL